MYKKFFMGIAAMAALTLVSCSSDDLNSLSDNSSKNEAISFDGYLGRSAVAVNGSRGSVLDINALKASTEVFGVFGNYSTGGQKFGANLFDNLQVKYSSADKKWTYSPLKYWPTQGHIDFLAYAPYNAGKVKDTYCLDFTVSPTIPEQKDLLYAKAVGQTMANNSGAKKVKFQFEHALSRLGYSVKLKGTCSSDATIKLKKITLAGSAPETTTGTTTEPTGAFHKTGTIDLSTGNWTPTSDKQAFKWFSAETPGSQPITFTSAFNTSTSNKTYTNTDKEYLFVIPQNFSQDGNTLYVIVEYTIQYTGVTEPITNKVYKQITQNFEKGKAYMINLTIGRPIEFDADVTEWGKDNPYDIDSWEYNK